MNTKEKYFARILFKLQIHQSDEQAFQDLFSAIMSYAEGYFRPTKAWEILVIEKMMDS